MTNKIKRLNKILSNIGIKGFFKPAENLEDSHFVIIEDKRCIRKSLLIDSKKCKALLERGETHPPDIVHFIVITNKRNVQNIKNNLFTLPTWAKN